MQEAIGLTLSTLPAGDLWACGHIIQCDRPLSSAIFRFVVPCACSYRNLFKWWLSARLGRLRAVPRYHDMAIRPP